MDTDGTNWIQTGQRVFGVARTFDAACNRLTTTGYDQAGLNPEGEQVTGTVDYHDVMTHDAQNRMASITRRVGPDATALAENPPGAMHVLFGYDAADRPTRTIRYAGAGLFSTPVTTLSTHDGAGRIAAIDHAFGGNTISRYTSTFDDAGQLAERSAKLTSSAVDAALRDFDGLVDIFDHDARGQVILGDSDLNAADERFATDAAGNRTGRSTSITGVPAETHAIGEYNRLDGDGVYTYTHDAEGNRTGKVGGGESWTYTWDHRNRLSSASEAGGQSISYVYDGMDRLIGRVSRLGNQVTDRQAYGHDGGQVTLVLEEFGPPSVRYLWGPGTDQLIGMQEVAAPGGQANAISWTLTDHLGSVRDRVDEAGVLLGHADYTIFGEVIDQTAMDSVSVGEAMAYGFTGRPTDVLTGLQNNRARWYDAVSGIWVSQDPIGFAAGDANLYRYVGNSPTTKTDPSGLVESTAIDIPIQAGAGVLQGGANIVNGIQDTAVGLGNLVIGIPNMTASGLYWMRGTDKHNRISIPYIPSRDWSRNLTVHESDTCHGVSKFAGAGGVEIYTGVWVAKVSKARAAAALAAEGAGAATGGSTGVVTLSEIAPTIADDAIINLGGEVRSVISPPGGRSYWFRFGDVKHLTPEQVRTLIGQMASAGTREGSKILRVAGARADECEKVRGVAGFFEYILKVPVQVADNIPLP